MVGFYREGVTSHVGLNAYEQFELVEPFMGILDNSCYSITEYSLVKCH